MSFGVVEFLPSVSKPQWSLRLEPHVAVRAKRVFGQLGRQYKDELLLSDTIDVCRDLEWFLERYPVTLREKDRAYLRARATEHRHREERTRALYAGTYQAQLFDLAVALREYQRVAADLFLQNRSLLLGDDVGLGKSATAIAALTDPRARPALVVTYTHLTRQWTREINRFAPGLTVHTLKKTEPYPLDLDGQYPDIILTSYAKLTGWASTLSGRVRGVVFDEVQELRTGTKSKKGEAAYQIADNAPFRCGMSATPIYNYGGEIWNVFRAIAPDALGSYEEFATEWCAGVDDQGRARLKDPKVFGEYLRQSGFFLRRTREDVGRELPEVQTITHEVDSDDRPMNEIKLEAEQLAHIILEATGTARAEKMQAAAELNNKVRHATGVAKGPYVAEFVRILVESGEQVVLYGWHRSVFEIWRERLKGFEPVFFTGTESPAQKDAARTKFLSGESRVLIMSLRSGAGLDGLQGVCKVVVFGELDWSPGVHHQCIGRVHRDGQQDGVVVYYLLTDRGSDPLMSDVLGVKRAQSEGIRNPNASAIEELQIDGDHIKRLAQTYLRRRRAS